MPDHRTPNSVVQSSDIEIFKSYQSIIFFIITHEIIIFLEIRHCLSLQNMLEKLQNYHTFSMKLYKIYTKYCTNFIKLNGEYVLSFQLTVQECCLLLRIGGVSLTVRKKIICCCYALTLVTLDTKHQFDVCQCALLLPV